MDRRRKANTRNRWREGMARRRPVLAQWLPVLFWLLLCSEAVNLVDQRVSLSGIWDGISLVVSTVLAIGMLVVFWKLAPLSRRVPNSVADRAGPSDRQRRGFWCSCF